MPSVALAEYHVTDAVVPSTFTVGCVSCATTSVNVNDADRVPYVPSSFGTPFDVVL